MVWPAMLALAWAQSGSTDLVSPFPGGLSLSVTAPPSSLAAPKVSPKNQWSFDLLSVVSIANPNGAQGRLRVFGQSSTPKEAALKPESTARALARVFDLNFTQFKLDHTPEFGNQQVDVYLCSQGQPGAEQLFGEDPGTPETGGAPGKVNTIYVYQVGTLTEPVEALREIVHEYGHATLPPVKTTGGHEEWANGDLGERIYMTWVRDCLAKKTLEPADVLGVDLQAIVPYVKTKVAPSVSRVGTKGPDFAACAKGDMAAYLDVAIYAFRLLPPEVFRRALVLNPDQTPKGFLTSLMEAVQERERIELNAVFPVGSEFWVPVGKARLSGAKVIATRGGWAKVHSSGKVVLANSA
ncbi:MAG: hypothetical protein JSS66_09775 [Armatimonadetes bacterium]|nr:hypothetical protein [Armatimonadota bacterium]